MKLLSSILIAAITSITLTLGVSAATITDGTKGVDLTCTGSCEFWDLDLAPDGFNASDGSWLSGSYGGINNSNSNANRLTFTNNVLGTSFASQSSSSDSGVGVPLISPYQGGDNASWTSSASYFLAWGGNDPRYILIKNNTANNMFTWTTTGQRSGLSGVDGFGPNIPPDGPPPGPPTVPLPAAGFMLLMGLGGFAVMRRRKT